MTILHHAFLDRDIEVAGMLSEDVAYSWVCGHADDPEHTHVIECLWIWHNCDLSLDPVRRQFYKERAIDWGWTPTGVAAHDLISVEPLHIEASIFWPDCCGMHGWIRDGKYEPI